ncbi:UDP-2,4-diacetamido-2,4,6-trideoxy-beta-L-altropyranose hydrolase [Caminibacter pacificus]
MTLIRVDFSSDIGLGHLKRATLFSEKLKLNNEKIVIICKECEQKQTDFPIIQIKDENEFFEIVKKLHPDKVIVDNYDFTYEEEKKFKNLFPDIKLICFDDTYKKHCCDEIINVNPAAKREKYPKNVKVTILKKPLVGENFKKAKKRHFKRKGIFISFGGTDAKEMSLKVLNILKKHKLKTPIHLYTTSANKNLKKIKKFCFLNRWCHLHIDEDVALAMAKNEFGIITPSTIALEAMYMKLPFISVQIADNQKEIAKYLKQKRIKVLSEREIQKIPRFIFRRKKRGFRVEKSS